jgi:ketosteroid isomerase-like protein
MTQNKETVATYMDGFRKSDHELILSCLTDDIEWELPGIFHIFGKESFDKEIENEAFVGRPTIIVTRMIEENNVVVAEGKVMATKREGSIFNAVFCDVFDMEDMKIKRIISYLNQI